MTRLARTRRPLWQRALLGLVVLGLLAALGGWLYVRQLLSPAGGPAYTLEVQPGDTLAGVARELEDKNIVRSADALRFVMRQNGTAGRMKEGLYDLTGQMDVQAVAEKLAGPARIPVVKVTIPEGRRVRDLPAIFEKAGFDGAALASELRDTSLSRYATSAQPDLEGFVFPATYEFRPQASARQIVQEMLGRMTQEFTPQNVAAARALGLSVRDWVILGSMVQAEAANDAEMNIIAGVFLNRLDIGDRLRSDPTVAYGLGKDLPQLNRFEGDFEKDTPYNSYTRGGLPAGPINNPGRAALQSVLNPERKLPDGRDALFFLHGLDGNIYVNHTFAEHQRDVARYR